MFSEKIWVQGSKGVGPCYHQKTAAMTANMTAQKEELLRLPIEASIHSKHEDEVGGGVTAMNI